MAVSIGFQAPPDQAWRRSSERLYETLVAGPFANLKQKATGQMHTRGRRVGSKKSPLPFDRKAHTCDLISHKHSNLNQHGMRLLSSGFLSQINTA